VLLIDSVRYAHINRIILAILAKQNTKKL